MFNLARGPNKYGPTKVPFESLQVPTVLSQTSDIGPNPLILGSGSTGLPDSDDRVHSGLVPLLANTGIPDSLRRAATTISRFKFSRL